MNRRAIHVTENVDYVLKTNGWSTQVGDNLYNEFYLYMNDGSNLLVKDSPTELNQIVFQLNDSLTPVTGTLLYSRLSTLVVDLSNYERVGDLFFLKVEHTAHPVISIGEDFNYSYAGYSSRLCDGSLVHSQEVSKSGFNLWVRGKASLPRTDTLYRRGSSEPLSCRLLFSSSDKFILELKSEFLAYENDKEIHISKSEVNYAAFTNYGYCINGTTGYAFCMEESDLLQTMDSKGLLVMTKDDGWIYAVLDRENPPVLLKRNTDNSFMLNSSDYHISGKSLFLVFNDMFGARVEVFDFNYGVAAVEMEQVGYCLQVRVLFDDGSLCDFDIRRSDGEYKCFVPCTH